MPSPARYHSLNRRQDGWNSGTQTGVIVALVVVGVVCIALFSYFFLRYARIRHNSPRLIPGAFLKSKWRAWQPARSQSRASNTVHDARSVQELPQTQARDATINIFFNANDATGAPDRDDYGQPDRRISVRSVMTLPAYSADARPTEKIIGREGDRGGIDVVVEFPEAVEDEEARREAEMESLYQIRAARRAERTTRTERRQARRAARARGDTAALERIRTESASTTTFSSPRDAATMLREHQARGRGRRVSSVSYMDLGVARHDGSRVRAGSHDSERPLLPQTTTSGSRRGSHALSMYQAHLRNQSTSTLRYATPDYQSDDDRSSADFDFVFTPQEMSRRPSTARRASLPASLHRSASHTHSPLPPTEPPHYDLHHLTQQSGGSSPPAPPYEDVASNRLSEAATDS